MNDMIIPQSLAAGGPDCAREARGLPRRARLARHVVSRDARRRERGADLEGRGSDRVRLGLPRGDLRRVRVPGQRHRARAGSGHDGVPAAHAPLQGRRHAHARAVARAGLPGHQGSRRRSQRLRPDHPGGRLHVDQHRRRAGREHDPDRRRPLADRAMDSAACIGCGACVAACKNASAALFTSAKVSHLALLPQGQVERTAGSCAWSSVTTARASAAARTKGNAKRSARRRSRSRTSPG